MTNALRRCPRNAATLPGTEKLSQGLWVFPLLGAPQRFCRYSQKLKKLNLRGRNFTWLLFGSTEPQTSADNSLGNAMTNRLMTTHLKTVREMTADLTLADTRLVNITNSG